MCAPFELVKVIGLEATLKLQDELEGWLYIPAEHIKGHGRFAPVIGDRLTKLLSGTFPRERIWIGKSYIKRSRNTEIRRMASQGHHAKAVGKVFGISTRQVRNIAKDELRLAHKEKLADKVKRNARLASMIHDGCSAREAGKAFGITDEAVWNIMSAMRVLMGAGSRSA